MEWALLYTDFRFSPSSYWRCTWWFSVCLFDVPILICLVSIGFFVRQVKCSTINKKKLTCISRINSHRHAHTAHTPRCRPLELVVFFWSLQPFWNNVFNRSIHFLWFSIVWVSRSVCPVCGCQCSVRTRWLLLMMIDRSFRPCVYRIQLQTDRVGEWERARPPDPTVTLGHYNWSSISGEMHGERRPNVVGCARTHTSNEKQPKTKFILFRFWFF